MRGEQTRVPAAEHGDHRTCHLLPDVRHIEVSGAAHLVPLEAPDEANPLILDFL